MKKARLRPIAIAPGESKGIGPELWHSKNVQDLIRNLELEVTVFNDLGGDNGTRFALERAAQSCISGECRALVTGPSSKSSLTLSGEPLYGHTEILAKQTGTTRFRMLMHCPNLTILLSTNHVAIRDLPSRLSREKIQTSIEMATEYVQRLQSTPKIAVLSLNPHAGELGLLGTEELELLMPAIKVVREIHSNAQISDPISSDSFFGFRKYLDFDIVVAQYHDQALIPFKMLAGFGGVNITLGLPFLRVSVDHGPAYDIFRKNLANPQSLCEAIEYAHINSK